MIGEAAEDVDEANGDLPADARRAVGRLGGGQLGRKPQKLTRRVAHAPRPGAETADPPRRARHPVRMGGDGGSWSSWSAPGNGANGAAGTAPRSAWIPPTTGNSVAGAGSTRPANLACLCF